MKREDLNKEVGKEPRFLKETGKGGVREGQKIYQQKLRFWNPAEESSMEK